VGLARLARRPDGMARAVFVGRVGLGAALLVLALVLWGAWEVPPEGERTRLRNFFGVLHVAERGQGSDEHRRTLLHGDIIHGEQLLAPGREAEPSTYYGRESGLGRAIEQLHARGPGPLRAAMLGLGIGSAALLLGEGDEADFYEIDPDVVRLARGEGGHFDLLARARAQVRIHEGDGRDRLARDLREQGGAGRPLDLLAVDAFSGDAVPTHLLTKEAVALYARALARDGVLALHLSNLHLSLWRVAFPAVREAGLEARLFVSPLRGLQYDAAWLVASRDAALLERMATIEGWVLVGGDKYGARAWTDDRSSLLDVWR
jgi:hypothetical protein